MIVVCIILVIVLSSKKKKAVQLQGDYQPVVGYQPQGQYNNGQYQPEPQIQKPVQHSPQYGPISYTKPESQQPTNNSLIADELTKLKKLLDDGVITQEEFDAQKTKLLNQ